MEPTAVISWSVLGVTVTTHLFGPVSEERYEREKKATQHRAEQLEVQFPRTKNERYWKPKRSRAMGLAAGYDNDPVEWEE